MYLRSTFFCIFLFWFFLFLLSFQEKKCDEKIVIMKDAPSKKVHSFHLRVHSLFLPLPLCCVLGTFFDPTFPDPYQVKQVSHHCGQHSKTAEEYRLNKRVFLAILFNSLHKWTVWWKPKPTAQNPLSKHTHKHTLPFAYLHPQYLPLKKLPVKHPDLPAHPGINLTRINPLKRTCENVPCAGFPPAQLSPLCEGDLFVATQRWEVAPYCPYVPFTTIWDHTKLYTDPKATQVKVS